MTQVYLIGINFRNLESLVDCNKEKKKKEKAIAMFLLFISQYRFIVKHAIHYCYYLVEVVDVKC